MIIRRYHTDPMADAFDDAFPGFLATPARAGGQRGQALPVDVYEAADGYLLRVPLPGAQRESIAVSVDGSRVSIVAELAASAPAGLRPLLEECPRGPVHRLLDLGEELDSDAASASFRDGVLELQLPRRVARRGTRVEVR